MQDDDKKCNTCSFAETLSTIKVLCHRYPPSVVWPDVGIGEMYFPATYSNSWCGEWKEKEKENV